MRTCVLVAEDDKMQAELVRRYLEHEGHTAVVAHNGRSALDQARRRHPDLIILDVMMPGMDGLEVCRALRRESEVPVLMLTARTSEDDLLLGLDLGADDYMTKPYSPRELMARVRTLLRRNRDGSPWRDGTLRVGDLRVDPVGRRVTVGAVAVECTRGEFEVLTVMAAQPDRVFQRSQLLQGIHGLDPFTTERTIDMHVMNLRRKIEADPRHPRRLVTVFGVGYKLTDGTGGRRGAP